MINCWNRVLPGENLFRNFRTKVTRTRPHITVRQLEPGSGKCVFELFRVIAEAQCNFSVRWILLEGKIRGKHHRRMKLAFDVRIRHQLGSRFIGWNPLSRTRRALGLLPFELEQEIQIHVRPLDRSCCPGAF